MKLQVQSGHRGPGNENKVLKRKPRVQMALAALLAVLLVLAGCGKQSPAPTPTPDPDGPGTVGALTAAFECVDGDPVVNLSWEAVAGAESYSLERDYAVLAELEDAVSYTDATVANGETHTYRLTVSIGESEASSDAVTVDIPYYGCSQFGHRLAAGGTSSYAVAADGSLWSWGRNSSGQLGIGTQTPSEGPGQVMGLADVVSVSAGYAFAVALDASGVVWTFGDNQIGQLAAGPLVEYRAVPGRVDGLPEITGIAAGEDHVLALAADGTVWAWGDNDDGRLGIELDHGDYLDRPAMIAGLEDVVDVYAGGGTSFALHSDGSVSAWGQNWSGELGLGDAIARTAPEKIPGMTGIVAIATNYDYTVLIGADGDVWAMGYGDLLPNPSPINEYDPVLQAGLEGVVSLEAGYEFVIAVMEDGSVMGWGYNNDRQIIDSDVSLINPPVTIPGLADVVEVAAGDSHSLALTADGRVLAWGSNDYFQLGEADIQASFGFLPVDLPDSVAQASAGSHVLALLDDGTVWAWGSGEHGELGNVMRVNSGTPQQVQFPAGTVIEKVVAGESVSLALDSTGAIWSWGDNGYYALGQPGVYATSEPTKLAGVGPFTDMALDGWAVLAIDEDGDVWSWGYNYYGQLGLGDFSNRQAPTEIATLAGASGIAVGLYHSIVVLSNGQAWSMGEDSSGQLGNSAALDPKSNVPVQSLIANVVAAAAGTSHTVVLHDDGTVSGWGSNSNWQLGDPYSNRPVPAPVEGLDDIAQVAARNNSSMALGSDGTVLAWGDNQIGQLGLSGVDQSHDPLEVPIPGGAPVDEIVMGLRFSLVLVDGQLYATGANNHGQLGQGRVFERGAPQAVEGLPPVGVP